MNILQFVILVLCRQATLDDVMEERRRHGAIPIDILQYEPGYDYFTYRDLKSSRTTRPIELMFVFGANDSVIVRSHPQLAAVRARLENNEC